MNFDIISTWNLIRVSGFLAYFLFTLSVSAGLLVRLPVMQKKKALLLAIHQTSGWSGFLTTLFHMVLLVIDTYAPYRIFELLIPFSSENEPFFSALGTVGFYLFFIIFSTSDFFMKKLGRSLWKKIHFLVFPAWVMIVLHGMLIGTDSSEPWAAFLYGGGVVIVLFLLAVRRIDVQPKSTAMKQKQNVTSQKI
jgi:DMSO/TMAO reductase YedYZ heme-binding membrane subunit